MYRLISKSIARTRKKWTQYAYIRVYIKVFDFRRYRRYKVRFLLRYQAKRCIACVILGDTQVIQRGLSDTTPEVRFPR
ncbi:MAG: hypothetical protein Q605_AUC01157G0002 [Actinomyces urogenitalis DORA_12]|uniref:Uncharacterized protein n=1 Tax=Actinomyces urogenitalis DORA_12 TaxID=1403939 RepID=W1V5I6_9ACTO|nr:MAG: hypothetical protein Q605_AUC01157G0002 [Actinomyces urogenitalis DORA_12]